eukprot:333784-Prorocentrum_minimum.AAC.2
MEEAGLVGLSVVPLAALAEGGSVEGTFPIFSRRREITGHVTLRIYWANTFAPPAPPGGRVPHSGRRAMERLRQSRHEADLDAPTDLVVQVWYILNEELLRAN